MSACSHPATETRLYRQRNGSFHLADQCLTCGDRIGNWKKRTEPAAYPVWDDTIAEEFERWQFSEIVEREAERQLSYEVYLQSPEWRAKRAQVFARAEGRCEGCGKFPATQVHHLTYRHVGEELLWELRAVCDGCHRRCHPEKERS